MTSKTVDGVAATYTYDANGQLLSESRSGYSASYTYDANGNRASRTVNGVTETYTVDSGDKLTQVSVSGVATKTFGYDGAGRTTSIQTSSGATSFTYDFESRVTGITYPNASTNNFAYNGLDTRVGKTDSAGTATFRRMGAGVTAPVLGDGSASFTPGISERRGGASSFYGADYLGTNSSLYSSGETVSATRQYDAFGNLTSSSGSSANPFGFAGNWGYQNDSDSGLMLLGHRYYDASTGRFLTRDPIKDGRNWFAYCGNRVTEGVDPSGLHLSTLLLVTGDILAIPPPFPTGHHVDKNIATIRNMLSFEVESAAAGGGPGSGLSLGYWMGHVAPGGAWDYKMYAASPEIYDDAGNFNYGATGAAMGFPLHALLAVGEVDAELMYGMPDQPDDVYWTIRGFRYYMLYHE